MRTPLLRSWAGRACLAALAVWACIFTLRFWDQKIILGDEGVAVLGAWRIVAGDMPGRDFFEIIPPFSFLPTALAFKIFGLHLWAERGVALLLAGLLLFFVDRNLKKCGASLPARALSMAVLVPFGVLYWPVASHHWWVAVLQLASALALLGLPGSRRPALLAWVSGLLAGLALFTLQDQGLLFLLALAALVAFPSRREPWFRPACQAFSGGVVAVALAFALWLLPASGWRPYFEGWVLFPFTGYRGAAGNRFNLFAGWEDIGGLWSSGTWTVAPVYVVLLTACGAVILLLPLGAGLSAWVGWKKAPVSRRHALSVASCLAVASLVTAFHRWSLTNAIWAAPGLLVLLGAGLATASEKGGHSGKNGSRWLLSFLAAVFFAYGVSFYRLGDNAVSVETKVGTLRSLARHDAQNLRELLEALDRGPAPGEPIFCSGFISFVHFLSGHPNAVRYNVFLAPRYTLPSQSREVARRLASGEIRWVVADRLSLPPADDPTGEILRKDFALRFQNARFFLLERVGVREELPP